MTDKTEKMGIIEDYMRAHQIRGFKAVMRELLSIFVFICVFFTLMHHFHIFDQIDGFADYCLCYLVAVLIQFTSALYADCYCAKKDKEQDQLPQSN